MTLRKLLPVMLCASLSFGMGSAASAAEAYKIGMLTSLSGYVANMGLGGRDGLLLAIEDINKRGGVHGRKSRSSS